MPIKKKQFKMKGVLIWLTLAGFVMGNALAKESKTVYGYVEKVELIDKNICLPAKLDTGAKSASLSATNIQEIEENGKTYLSFSIPTKSGHHHYKAEYEGNVLIKSRAGEINKGIRRHYLKRPTVRLKVKLGDKERLVLFNLTNRKWFNYPILLGRDAIIAFGGIVDPATTFLQKNRKTC